MLLFREVDECLCQLAGAVPVEVMPGTSDPANHSLPQQPLHRCLFPGASTFTSFNRYMFWTFRPSLFCAWDSAACMHAVKLSSVRSMLKGW